jgi:hypothetical protein
LKEAARKNPTDKDAALALKLHLQRGHEIQGIILRII